VSDFLVTVYQLAPEELFTVQFMLWDSLTGLFLTVCLYCRVCEYSNYMYNQFFSRQSVMMKHVYLVKLFSSLLILDNNSYCLLFLRLMTLFIISTRSIYTAVYSAVSHRQIDRIYYFNRSNLKQSEPHSQHISQYFEHPV